MNAIAYCINEELKNFDQVSFEEVSTDELFKQEVEFRFRGREVSIVRQHETQDQLRINFFMGMLNATKNLPDSNFNVIVNFDDDVPHFNPKAPRLCFSRRKGQSNILIPDPHILNGIRISHSIPPSDPPFSQKLPKVIFAGSDTGYFKSAHKNQRFQFCYKNIDNPKGIFKITQFVEIDKFGTDTLSSYDINRVKSNFISIPHQLYYRYIMNINGNTTCWDRLLWAMSSNSLCLFLNPPVEQMSWYYHYLEKEKALFYVSEDNWEEVVDDLNKNRAKAEKIVEYQKEFIAPFLVGDNHISYFQSILTTYNKYF